MSKLSKQNSNTLKRLKRKNSVKAPSDYFGSSNADGNLPPFFVNCISFLEECGTSSVLFIT